MEEIKTPQVDPQLDGFGDLRSKTENAIELLNAGSIKSAKEQLHNTLGYVNALEKYFDLELKKRYNISN